MIINHNLSAMFANRTLMRAEEKTERSAEKLTTGLRVNRAGDDPAALDFQSQIRGLNQASSNAQNGITFIKIAEGYLQETQDILHRLRELAVQSSNGIYSSEGRTFIQVEVSALVDELDRIASSAQFNGMNLLTGRFARPSENRDPSASMWLHIGANMDQKMQVFVGDMTSDALGIRGADDHSILSLLTPDDANRAIGTIDNALTKINKQRADLGGYQNRLEHMIRGIDSGSENLQYSESKSLDADMASVMVDHVRNQLLDQAATAMLAQANQKHQNILQLLT